MSIKQAMNDEVIRELEKVKEMEPGSDQQAKTVSVANSMVDRLCEFQKLENERKRLELEERKLTVEAVKLENEKRGRTFKDIATVGIDVAFLVVTIWGYIDSKKFEQGYTHTTESGKSSSRTLMSLWSKTK